MLEVEGVLGLLLVDLEVELGGGFGLVEAVEIGDGFLEGLEVELWGEERFYVLALLGVAVLLLV